MELREITELAVILRLAAALICGGIIGFERGIKNHPAGLRTYMLVCVGSCLIMLTNQYIYQASQVGDPMRLGAQVVSGIGFLGAGTIVVTRHNQIKGLTTAAGLWTAAGVGLALGVGFYEAAVVAGFLIFFVLTVLQYLDDKMRRKTRVVEIYMELTPDTKINALVHGLREIDVEIFDIQMDKAAALEDGTHSILASLRSKKRCRHTELVEKVKTIPGILYIEILY